MEKCFKKLVFFLIITQIISACSIDKKNKTKDEPNSYNNKTSIQPLNSNQLSDLTSRMTETIERHSSNNEQLRFGVNAKKNNNSLYDRAWQNKVAQISTINYPHAAVKNKITGNVTLEVQINADGSIFNIIILKSSGHKILDSAAIKIINLSAPFAPLPEAILAETKIYHIVRIWHFNTGESIF